MRTARIVAIVSIATGMTASLARADVVTLGASRDNTLYEDDSGSLSNGSGEFLFVGRVGGGGGGLKRRAVLAFDIADHIPSGAVINSVSLTLHMSRTISGPQLATLHRLSADWGEGVSDAGNPGGTGAASAPDDATWIHRFFDTGAWATPGGDYAPAASATRMIEDVGSYVWSSAEMVADVQTWLDQPADDHGWVLVGNESVNTTAKRFDSREHGDPAMRPTLEIDYTTEPPAVPSASNWSVALLIAVFVGALVVTADRRRVSPSFTRAR